jgi:hypothetical protein
VYFNVRLEEERSCILVVRGANYQGKKELLAVRDGYRESEHSWKEVLLELKSRGLQIDPKLAIADGALGFWKAPASGISHNEGSPLLAAQNREHRRQDGKERSKESGSDDPRHLHGREQSLCRESLQAVL